VLRRRLLQAIPVVLGVSILTFLLLNLIPGNAALNQVGPGATAQALKAAEVQDGLNQPLWERYWHWLEHALQGNLGDSLSTHQSVSSLILHALPVSVELLILAQVFSLLFAVPVALIAVGSPWRWVDRVLGIVTFAGISVPPFLLGIWLILLFSVNLDLLPASGWVPLSQSISGNLQTVILPAATLAIGEFCFHMRILRGDMLEQLREEYVDTARAKGAGSTRVLIVHVLRNSLFVLVTVVGVNFGKLLSGAVIVESLFSVPGVGNLLVNAIEQRDYPLVEGIVVCMALAFVLINLAVDLLYGVLDPRVRLAGAHG
jgi:peptide/nickel transport system permease protein